MSEQSSPTNSTDNSKKIEFGGINVLIGLVIGTALQFGWWALIDRLSLRTVVPSNAGFLAQLLTMIDQSRTAGFLLGALTGASTTPVNAPIRLAVSRIIKWAFGFALAFYCLDVVRLLLQMVLGESLGDIVSSALFFGLCGAFLGLVYVLKQSVAPDIERVPVGFRQLVQWTRQLDRSSVRRVLIVALLGALLGISFAMLLQGLNAWLLMMLPIAAAAIIAVRMWRPTRQTLKKLAIGALTLIIIIGLVLLVGLSVQLGLLAGIIILVVYAVIQSRK